MYRKIPKRDRRPNAPRGTVYLLHFERPVTSESGKRTQVAKHYLGWAYSLEARLSEHRHGSGGGRLVCVARARGIGFIVARTWENVTRHEERRLKNMGSSVRHCPICKAEATRAKTA